MDRAPGSAAGGESGAGPINAGAIAASSGGLAATLSAIHAGIRVPAMLHAFALNVNYNLWFLTMFPCWFWQEFAREDSAPRLRFLLGFAFTWFLGTCVLGTIFSSGGGGPCFSGRLLPGPDPYVPLMAWLHESAPTYGIWSPQVMDAPWKNYETGVGSINGISATPELSSPHSAGGRQAGW